MPLYDCGPVSHVQSHLPTKTSAAQESVENTIALSRIKTVRGAHGVSIPRRSVAAAKCRSFIGELPSRKAIDLVDEPHRAAIESFRASDREVGVALCSLRLSGSAAESIGWRHLNDAIRLKESWPTPRKSARDAVTKAAGERRVGSVGRITKEIEQARVEQKREHVLRHQHGREISTGALPQLERDMRR